MTQATEIFAVTGISEGKKARLARISRGWRQVDLACHADVNVGDVCALEHDRFLLNTRKAKILRCLGLIEDEITEAN